MTQREKTSQTVQKNQFFIFWDINVYIFSNGIYQKNFSEPYFIIWKVWKWGKTGICVEVVQKIQNKIVCVLLSYLSVWPRFKVTYFILRVLVGGIWVKMLQQLSGQKKGENVLRVVKKYQNLFFMFYSHIWGTD